MKKSYHSSAEPIAEAIITLRCDASIVLPFIVFQRSGAFLSSQRCHRACVGPAAGYRRAAFPPSCVASQTEIGQARMMIGAAAGRPMELAVGLLDWQIVDARDASLHQSLFVEFPVFIAIRAKPVFGVVMPFISKANGDARFVKCPKLLDQAIVEFFGPFAPQELDDGLAPGKKLGPVAPLAVDGIDQRHPLGVARIPAVFGQAHL